MAAGRTYTPIATQTVNSSTASVTFSSIPSGYTDLILVMSNIVTTNNSNVILLQCGNGSVDTGNNYSTTSITGDGATARSGRESNTWRADILGWQQGTSTTPSYPSQGITNIMNYSNTTTYKTMISRDGAGNSTNYEAAALVGLWRSTAAINIITLYCYSGNISTGNFTLYGIAAA